MKLPPFTLLHYINCVVRSYVITETGHIVINTGGELSNKSKHLYEAEVFLGRRQKTPYNNSVVKLPQFWMGLEKSSLDFKVAFLEYIQVAAG